jgi:serine/threonine-protein kinase
VLHQIGAGTLGPVFRAYDAERERLVAVKLFHVDLPPERVHQLVASFEDLIAAELTHPAIAVPLATGITNVSAYLAQDYVAAESLDLAVRGYGAAPPADALRVATQLAGALDFAAAASISHGALHPRDVLLSSDETRLTGLGVMPALEKVGIAAPVRRPYTAPERIAGTPADRRADLFSLAALIHELLWARRISGYGQLVADALTDLPGARLKALQATFARALAEQPSDRFATALEFAESLKEAFPEIALAEPAPPRKRTATGKKTVEARLPLDLPASASPPAPVPPVRPEPVPVAPDVHRDADEIRASGEIPDVDLLELRPPVTPAADADLDETRQPGEPEAEPEHREKLDAPLPVPASTPQPAVSAPPGISLIERSRSAVWPLMAALLVGLAIGFAGGFGMGSRERPPQASMNAVSAATPPAAVPAPAPAPAQTARRSTEVTVPPAPKPAPSRPASQGRAGTRSAPAPSRTTADRTASTHTSAPPRSPASAPRTPAAAADREDPELGTAGRFVGRLTIESRPDGARVFLDGKLVGTTPLSLPSVSAGEHAVRLEREGYRRWSSSARIVASEQNRITASLER